MHERSRQYRQAEASPRALSRLSHTPHSRGGLDRRPETASPVPDKTASRRESESPVSEKRPALGGSPVRRSVKPHSPNGRKAGEHRKQATILAVRSRPDPHSGNGAPRPIDRETVCLALPKEPWQRMARQQNEFERFTCRIKEKGAAIFIAAPSRCPGKDSNLHIITDTST